MVFSIIYLIIILLIKFKKKTLEIEWKEEQTMCMDLFNWVKNQFSFIKKEMVVILMQQWLVDPIFKAKENKHADN